MTLGVCLGRPTLSADRAEVEGVPSNHHSHEAHQRLAILGEGVPEMPGSLCLGPQKLRAALGDSRLEWLLW